MFGLYLKRRGVSLHYNERNAVYGNDHFLFLDSYETRKYTRREKRKVL